MDTEKKIWKNYGMIIPIEELLFIPSSCISPAISGAIIRAYDESNKPVGAVDLIYKATTARDVLQLMDLVAPRLDEEIGRVMLFAFLECIWSRYNTILLQNKTVSLTRYQVRWLVNVVNTVKYSDKFDPRKAQQLVSRIHGTNVSRSVKTLACWEELVLRAVHATVVSVEPNLIFSALYESFGKITDAREYRAAFNRHVFSDTKNILLKAIRDNADSAS